MDDTEIRALVTRLGRPHRSGGVVVERAAILAEGADFDAVMAWILAHHGEPEVREAPAATGGLHSRRLSESPGAAAEAPRRFLLPAGALS
jgi:hypothetical protein